MRAPGKGSRYNDILVTLPELEPTGISIVLHCIEVTFPVFVSFASFV